MIEESKDELQKKLDKPGNSSRNDFIAGLVYKHSTKLQENKHARGDRIIFRTGKLDS